MAKRLNGEGTIYKTSRGNYRAQITIDGRRLSSTRKTARECREWLREQQENQRIGINLNSAEQLLKDYLDDWLANVRISNSAMTYASYEMLTRIYIVPRLGTLKLSELTPSVIQAAIDQSIKEGLPTPSIVQAFGVLKNSLFKATRLHILGYNPAEKVVLPKPPRKKIQVLDENQVQSYLLAVDKIRPRNWCLLKVALGTGMRLGELVGLKWSDIGFEKGQITIQRQLHRMPKDGVYFGPVKTKASRRTIIIGPSLISVFRERQHELFVERKVKPNWEDHDMVFPGRSGKPQNRSTPQYHHKKILKTAGLPDMRFHDLRHTAISLMLKRGVPVVEVARYAGHAKVSVTLDTYGHFIPGWQDQAASAMDEIFDIQTINI